MVITNLALKMGNCRLLLAFLFFASKIYDLIKIVDFSGILTWIVGVEGERADHQTPTHTSISNCNLWQLQLRQKSVGALVP